jgi:hypothetical protein
VSKSADVDRRGEAVVGLDGREFEVIELPLDARLMGRLAGVSRLGAKERVTCSTTRARDAEHPASRGRVVADPSIK